MTNLRDRRNIGKLSLAPLDVAPENTKTTEILQRVASDPSCDINSPTSAGEQSLLPSPTTTPLNAQVLLPLSPPAIRPSQFSDSPTHSNLAPLDTPKENRPAYKGK